MQRRHRAQRLGQWLPAGNGAGTFPRLRVVGDPREPPPQLDDGRQLAVLVEGGADRGGIGLGDDEHGGSMEHARRGRQAGAGHFESRRPRVRQVDAAALEQGCRSGPALPPASPPERGLVHRILQRAEQVLATLWSPAGRAEYCPLLSPGTGPAPAAPGDCPATLLPLSRTFHNFGLSDKNL